VGTERPENAETFSRPTRCPVCSTPVVQAPGEVVLRCPNRACPAVVASRLRHFVSRGAMEIEGLGGKLLDQLAREELISDPASLWELDVDTLAGLPGWGDRSAANLMQQLEQAKARPLHRLLFALGIPLVGEGAARTLATRYGSIDRLGAVSEDELEGADGIGPVMARTIRAWFAEQVSKCILCYACRSACPMCYCKECFVESTQPQWMGREHNLSNQQVYHLVRALHLGGNIKSLSQGEIDARNRGYKPYSPETWRAWEYWATKCGCAEMLTRPDAE